MRILDSTVQLSATHVYQQTSVRQESFEAWVGEAPRSRPASPSSLPEETQPQPAAAAAPPVEGSSEQNEVSEAVIDRDAIDRLLLEKHFGKGKGLHLGSIKQAYADGSAEAASTQAVARQQVQQQVKGEQSPTAAPAAPAEGWGLRYDLVELHTESESTSFQASARVTTADGRTIDVDAALSMARTEAQLTEVHVRAGDAAKVDPLVLNLQGGAASFSGQTTFDLDGDGATETVAQLGGGSAYLALDKNGNGMVDSGKELFGPSTGSGFGELAALDQDGNGWVDEGDSAYQSLRLWNQEAGTLSSLSTANVGAIYARSAATPFDLKDASGALQASVAETGLFLREDGSAGTVQHVDLVA